MRRFLSAYIVSVFGSIFFPAIEAVVQIKCAHYRRITHSKYGDLQLKETRIENAGDVCSTKSFCLTEFSANKTHHIEYHTCAETYHADRALLPYQRNLCTGGTYRGSHIVLENRHNTNITCCQDGDCCNMAKEAVYYCRELVEAREALRRSANSWQPTTSGVLATSLLLILAR